MWTAQPEINPEFARRDDLHFEYLPHYAQYLLDHQLEAFAAAMLKASREVNLPLLRFLETLPEAELVAMSLQGTRVLLENFVRNTAWQFLEESLKNWIENRLPMIQYDKIAVEDISKVCFIRRKVFRDFLQHYSADLVTYVRVMEELDRFTVTQEEVSFKTLFDLKQQRIEAHHHFIDKINNASPGIIYVFDLLEQKEIYSNHKREELLGYTEEDMKSMGNTVLAQILHPGDLPQAFEHIQHFSTVADGEIRTNEYRVRHKQGPYKWHRAYETVFKRTPAGLPAQIIGIAIDISSEKEAVHRLEHSEHQLREAQEIAGLGSFEWDLEGENSIFSPQLLKIFEVEGRTNLMAFLEHVHPSDRKNVKDALEKALHGDGEFESEYRYRKGKTEKVVWSRGFVTFRDGKPVRMNGTVMDVTQRHHMLKRLERSEELHNQAQALTHLGNWSWFIADNTISWSDELYRIYGLEPQSEDITFERFLSLIHPDDREKRQTEIRQALETLHAEDYTMRIVCDDGTEKIIQGKGEVLVDEYNKPYKLVGTCQDVTREKKAEMEIETQRNQLVQKNLELERSNQELMAFNYIASHDLQEPIRKIKIFSSRILEKNREALPVQLRDFVERIAASAEHMQKLIKALLAFSRAATVEKILQPVDLNDLLREVQTSLKEAIDEKNAVVTATPLPVLDVIRFQFKQLLENILGNALKYSRPGVPPQIRIEAGLVPGHQLIEEGAIAEKNYHHISVADNGIGFDPQYARKIFDLFQRLHRKNEYAGTGVGLAICKKIVEHHHGFITAESQPGEGARFNIYIPEKA